MKLASLPSFYHSRHAFWALAFAAVATCVSQPSIAREIRATPTEETLRLQEEARKHEEAVWATIEPQIMEWTAKGKPYIPQAALPGDLPQASVPAFLGAEGAGKFSFGGRGGRVWVVTSLEDSGPGSFREACEAAGPRIIVFNVSGIIRLKSPLHIRAPYITIAGQTAPGDGVCVAGGVVGLDTHDVVVQYMRFRRGLNDEQHREHSLTGHAVGNIIVDHCSVSWSMEENLSIYRHMYSPKDGPKDLKLPTVNITIQWCISSEGLDPNDHAFGGTWGGRNTSFHHNLFACNSGRNPSIGMSYDFNFVNNVIYNWRHRTVDGGDKGSLYNIINNYFKPGPATPVGAPISHRILKPQSSWSKKQPVDLYGRAYVAGNVIEGSPQVTEDNWNDGVQFSAPPPTAEEIRDEPRQRVLIEKVRSTEPFPMASIRMQSAKEAYDLVLENVGATLPVRDPIDQRILNEVRTGTVTYAAGKGIIKDIAQVGGFPEYKGTPHADLCPDGIPLSWKTKYKLDVKDPALASKDLLGDGYTVMDKYLGGLDPTKRLEWR